MEPSIKFIPVTSLYQEISVLRCGEKSECCLTMYPSSSVGSNSSKIKAASNTQLSSDGGYRRWLHERTPLTHQFVTQNS